MGESRHGAVLNATSRDIDEQFFDGVKDGVQSVFLSAFFPQPDGVSELVHGDAVVEIKHPRPFSTKFLQRHRGVQQEAHVPRHGSDVGSCLAGDAGNGVVSVHMKQFKGVDEFLCLQKRIGFTSFIVKFHVD